MKKNLAFYVVLTLLTIGMFFYAGSNLWQDLPVFLSGNETVKASVVEIQTQNEAQANKRVFKARLLTGEHKGDEVMAFFSGPKKEINACKAAIEIRQAMRHAQQEAIKAGKATVSIGIGINSGKVVFGPVGSKTRKDYTSIGDTVNLAARLEGANKEYGSKCIISETVYNNLSKDFICRELDFIAVKGKTEAVRIFEVLHPSEKLPAESIPELKKTFEAGLAYYRNKKWSMAEKYFTACVEKYNDAPAKVFLRRIMRYQVSPPKAGWNGVFVMNAK